MRPYVLVEKYADNGALSHFALVRVADGSTVWEEPEEEPSTPMPDKLPSAKCLVNKISSLFCYPPDYPDVDTAQALIESAFAAISADEARKYEEILADRRRLVREIDVSMNGEAGAAKQASLCDIAAQIHTQSERYAACVDALKDIDAQFHAQELADKLVDRPCPKYQCASVYLDITKTRKALAELEGEGKI